MESADFERISTYLRGLPMTDDTYVEVNLVFRAGRFTFARSTFTERFDFEAPVSASTRRAIRSPASHEAPPGA